MKTAMTQTAPNRLRHLRESDGLTREQLAVAFEVDRDTIRYWETTSIPAKHLRRIATHFKVSVDHLLGDGEQAA